MIYLFIIIYLMFPILLTPIIIYNLFKNGKYYKLYLLMLSCNIGFIGYYYIPPVTYDLYRHFQKIDMLKSLGFQDFLSSLGETPLFIGNIIFYFVGLTEDYNLLPFLAIAVTYYFAFLTIYEYFILKKVNKFYIFYSMLFVLAWFQLILPMSGIRFSSALSLSVYSIYRIYCKNDNKAVIYIILASFFHVGVILLLVILFLLKFVNTKIVVCIIIIIGLSLEAFLVLLQIFPIEYFALIVYKIEAYSTFRAPSILDTMLYYLKILSCSSIFIYILLRKKHLNKQIPKHLIDYILILLLIFLVFFSIPTTINRYSYFILIFVPIVIGRDFLNLNKNLRAIMYILFSPIILLGFYIQYLQLRLSIFKVTFFDGLFSSFFSMIF